MRNGRGRFLERVEKEKGNQSSPSREPVDGCTESYRLVGNLEKWREAVDDGQKRELVEELERGMKRDKRTTALDWMQFRAAMVLISFIAAVQFSVFTPPTIREPRQLARVSKTSLRK